MTTHKLNLIADYIPEPWMIERLREERERAQRPRPFMEMPQRAPDPLPEREEAPMGGSVIIIDI